MYHSWYTLIKTLGSFNEMPRGSLIKYKDVLCFSHDYLSNIHYHFVLCCLYLRTSLYRNVLYFCVFSKIKYLFYLMILYFFIYLFQHWRQKSKNVCNHSLFRDTCMIFIGLFVLFVLYHRRTNEDIKIVLAVSILVSE